MGTGYNAPDFNAAPHITGAPGPPCPPASCYMMREEDDEDMLIGGEPDDLGDLMQQMQEGAAWAEDLVMHAEMQLCSSGPTPTYGAAPAAPPQAAAGPTSRAPAGSLADSMQALASLTERHSLDQASEEDAAAAGLQPALRALLMHPGGRGGGHMMIPCGGPPPGGMSCAASLAAASPSSDGCPVWPSAPPPQQQAQFYGGPPPPPMEQPGAGQFYGMPNTAAPAMRSSASAFQSMQYFQGAPVGFPPQPLPPQQLPQQRQQQWQQSGQGTAKSGRMPGMPPQQQAQQALQALQQQQCQQGMMQAMFPPGPSAAYPQMQHLPQPSCGSGSGNASDGTTLRMRNSFDSDTGGSAVAPCGSCPSAPSAAPAPQHAHHAQQGQHSPAPASEPTGQMCSAAALAAFDQAAFDQQPSTGGERVQTWRVPSGGGGVPLGMDPRGECDAPSDSSDCEDHERSELTGPTSRDHSAQVVPEVNCYPCAPHLALAQGQPSSVCADFPPLPVLSSYYDTPAAHTARMARHASLARFRAKKLRRGFGKKIRYQARKVNADKRPRVKGRFVKAGEAADILAGRAAAAAAAGCDDPGPALSGPSGATSCFTEVIHA